VTQAHPHQHAVTGKSEDCRTDHEDGRYLLLIEKLSRIWIRREFKRL